MAPVHAPPLRFAYYAPGSRPTATSSNHGPRSTPFYIACKAGNLEMVRSLFQNGIGNDLRQPISSDQDVLGNDADVYTITPMLVACYFGHLKIVQFLCENGAQDDVTRSTNEGFTPMFVACHGNHLKIVKFLYEHGAQNDVTRPANNGATSMLISCEMGHLEIVHYLFENGAQNDISRPMNDGFITPMSVACQANQVKIVQFLCEHGATQDINKINAQKNSPLMIACEKNNIALLEWSIAKGLASKGGIKEWFSKKGTNKYLQEINSLTDESKGLLIQRGLENRDIDHESFLVFMCILRKINSSSYFQLTDAHICKFQRISVEIAHSKIFSKISDYVQGTPKTRSLWYYIVVEMVAKEARKKAEIQAEWTRKINDMREQIQQKINHARAQDKSQREKK